jgi:DNA-binding ferritin-like protein
MQPTRNTLSENIRAQSVELLNKHLAAAIDLHVRGLTQISRGIDQQLWFVESHTAQ